MNTERLGRSLLLPGLAAISMSLGSACAGRKDDGPVGPVSVCEGTWTCAAGEVRVNVALKADKGGCRVGAALLLHPDGTATAEENQRLTWSEDDESFEVCTASGACMRCAERLEQAED
jgi:hypothetical protein